MTGSESLLRRKGRKNPSFSIGQFFIRMNGYGSAAGKFNRIRSPSYIQGKMLRYRPIKSETAFLIATKPGYSSETQICLEYPII